MSKTIKFTNSNIGFYDELVSLLISLSSFIITIDLYANDHPLDYYRSTIYSSNLYGRFVIYNWNSHHFLNSIAKNEWPKEINLIQESMGKKHEPNFSVSVDHKGIFETVYSLVESNFILFYSKNEISVREKYGRETDNWPDIWNFCRVIRNAFAHGRHIHIRNQNSKPVIWKTCSIEYRNNGEYIFDIQKYIGPADIILLMIEADEKIKNP